MAIYQPSMVVPDLRSGLGLGVVDVTQGMTVSWRINGPNALTSYSITIYTNDSSSTQKYTTGQISTGCPAYGTSSTGAIQLFSYTIPAASLSSAGITNGNEYKLIIKQWWNANDSITQSSASAFVTRAAPTLSIAAIGTDGVIDTRYYTFTGNYAQAQGDTLNWFRWQIAYAEQTDNPFFDTENISGTLDVSCQYDGFFADTDYAIRLTAQTENGVEADTGWVEFSCDYSIPLLTGDLYAGCASGTDAVLVNWSEIGYVPGTADGPYDITDGILSLPLGSTISWLYSGTGAMNFAAPWCVIWRGILSPQSGTLFTIGQSDGDISLVYSHANATLTLQKGSTALYTQSNVINLPTVTALLTPSTFYLRIVYYGGGLYPATTLYPGAALYPVGDTQEIILTPSSSITYTQSNITSVELFGEQTCDFIEIVKGVVSAQVIAEAITNGTYAPAISEGDYMLADFITGLNAGTLDIGGSELQGFAVYRRFMDETALVKIAETDIHTDHIYDYSARSNQGKYTYYLFPIGTDTYISTPLVSGGVFPCWFNWTLMECEETDTDGIYTVLAAYKFKYNVSTQAMSNNNTPNILQNFTPYPTIQLAPQNYKSGTLNSLIGAINWSTGQPEYLDSTQLRDAIYALSTTQNALFLKSRKGDLLRIRVSAPTTMQTEDATSEQMQTMSLTWAEVGDAENVSLYSIEFVDAQGAAGAFVPQYYVNSYDATATPADIKILQTAYVKGKKITGEQKFYVQGTTLYVPSDWYVEGETLVIPENWTQ